MTDKTDAEKLRDLVPAYVNGTLSDADKTAFEAALQTSPALRRLVEEETDLQARVAAGIRSGIGSRDDRSVPHIQSLIKPGQTPERSSDNEGLASALAFLNPANWKPALMLALVAAAVGQAVIIGGQSSAIDQRDAQIAQLENDNYELASGGTAIPGKPAIMVELVEDAPWSEIAQLFANEGLVIARSTAQGVLLLRPADQDADIDALVEKLERSELIASVSKAG